MGVCTLNPVAEIPILSERVKVRRVDYWKSEHEIDAYIEHAYHYREVFGVGAAILCLGGCRISELLALKWGDVEWDMGYIRIRRIVERHTNTIHERTKGQKSGGEYQMLMFPRLRELLTDWMKRTPFKRDEDFIIRDVKGAHLSYDVYHKHHNRIIARAGLKRITLHDLRRTFASAAERAGFHKAEIGELLGHETLSATEAYTRVDVGHLLDKGKRVRFGT
jgi:integrase